MNEQTVYIPPEEDDEKMLLIKDEPEFSKKRTVVIIVSLFYMFYVKMYLLVIFGITRPQRQFIQDFLKTPLFWYNMAFLAINIIPYIILAIKKTPDDNYPVLKNIIKTKTKLSRKSSVLRIVVFSALCNFNVVQLLEMVIYPVLYWYNYGQSSVTCNSIVAFSLYLTAFYLSLKIWIMFVTSSYRAVFDTFTIWRFAMQRSRSSDAVQV
ncbi:uncharacterized protein EV154DRAFT_600575 [Mucor mucedo]|uniref:uncharacterized protein n=1 Tax=Mucor mucedo TaxID=29922 RepID=UPI00221F508F|nr:uncharacterized protein EV154DRAFT_600575 [Mucor mucedo]KAI7893731.1 hypothetical protein EV154DRAFT_600575 [Mucor mucedo]